MTNTPNGKPTDRKPNPDGQMLSNGAMALLLLFAVLLLVGVLAWSSRESGTSSLSYCEQAWEDNSVQASRDRPGTPAEIKKAYIATCEDGLRKSTNYQP